MSVVRRGKKVSCDVEEISPRKKRTEINGQFRMKACVVKVKPLSENEVKQYEAPSSDENGIVDLNRKFIKNEIVIVEDLKEELIRKDTQIKALQHQLDKERSKYDALVATSRQQQLENSQMIAKQRENIEQLTKANDELKNLIKDLREKNCGLSRNTSSTLNVEEHGYTETEPQLAEQNLLAVTEDIVHLDPRVIPLKMEIQESLDELKFSEALEDIYNPGDIVYPNIDFEDLTHVPLFVPKPDFVTMENLEMSRGIVAVDYLPKETENEPTTGSFSNHVTSLALEKPAVSKGKGFVEKSVNKKSCSLCLSNLEKSQRNCPLILLKRVVSPVQKEEYRQKKRSKDEKRFKCDQCKYAGPNRSKLIRHQRKHTGERPFKCDQCGYSSSEKSGLRRHQRIHTGERPFKCDLCDYASSDGSILKVHRRSHTGERPFKCIQCQSAFTQKHDLTRHMRTHTGERPYKCNKCNYKCSSKRYLNNHLNSH